MADRWSDNTGADRNAAMYERTFQPTTLDAEFEHGGWLLTTMPEGAGDNADNLATLHTIGNRGDEGENVESAVKIRPKGTAGNGT
jgi:hypothetical protein